MTVSSSNPFDAEYTGYTAAYSKINNLSLVGWILMTVLFCIGTWFDGTSVEALRTNLLIAFAAAYIVAAASMLMYMPAEWKTRIFFAAMQGVFYGVTVMAPLMLTEASWVVNVEVAYMVLAIIGGLVNYVWKRRMFG